MEPKLMTFMPWNDSYATGIEMIDAQHKELFRLINQVHDAAASGSEREANAPLLNALADYVTLHFDQEEALMESAGFTGLAEHKAKHHHARSAVLAFRNDYLDGRAVLNATVLEFLKQWLSDHILGTDRQYIPTVKAAQKKA
jgi:hemerythrin-like metal-binding protein